MDTDQTYLDAIDRFRKKDYVEFECGGIKRRGRVEIIHSDTTCTIDYAGMFFRVKQDKMKKFA